jgi:hypothetical protein
MDSITMLRGCRN